VGADNKRLLDVGRFRGAGYERAPGGFAEGTLAIGRLLQPRVGFVHVADDAIVRYDENDVLRKEVGDALADAGGVDPDSGVFGDGEFARKDREVDRCEVVRIVCHGEVDVARRRRGDHRADLSGVDDSDHAIYFLAELRLADDDAASAADDAEDFEEFGVGIILARPLAVERR
jgi:hypothetical protein